MSGRRSSHLNYWESLSDYKIRINQQSNNAVVTGATFGWFVVEYDSNQEILRVKFLADADDDYDTEVLAQSEDIAASSLPAEISLAEVDGSGVTATITLSGVRT